MRVIGAAGDFWRLRLTRLDTVDGLDFEWHDDILYRAPQVQDTKEVEVWVVEAVGIDDFETIIRVASFRDRVSAEHFYANASDDLQEMTKGQFEETYLTPRSPSGGPITE
jgi:hypothetical protein